MKFHNISPVDTNRELQETEPPKFQKEEFFFVKAPLIYGIFRVYFLAIRHKKQFLAKKFSHFFDISAIKQKGEIPFAKGIPPVLRSYLAYINRIFSPHLGIKNPAILYAGF